MTASTSVRAWAAPEPSKPVVPFLYDPGELGAEEVDIRVEHCGLCHSDLSLIDNEWGFSAYPIVGGHEVVGTVIGLGDRAKGLKLGQKVGLGWMSVSCQTCSSCLSGQPQLCRAGVPTIVGHHGGFADKVRAHWMWVSPIPEGLDPAKAGPLLCGGITVFSPLLNFDIKPVHRVGVVGIGGLGHLALKFARAWGCEVTAFTSSESKRDEALQMGAHRVVSSTDPTSMKSIAGQLDMVLVTVNVMLNWKALMSTLAPNGRLHLVGILPQPMEVEAFALIGGQRSVSGSPTGSRHDIDTMLAFAARHGIEPQTEHYPMSRINEALDHLRAGKARYRVVLTPNRTEFSRIFSMQFPESWLRTFCNPDLTTQQLADLLTMAGLEVEELQPVAPHFTGVIVAQVLEITKHPDADRLNVCKVDAGTGEVLQIVCGAPNVRPGIKVPCAMVGAELPPGADGKAFVIKKGKLRGVESFGMLCSAKELGISDESNGLHILADDAPVGLSIREHLKLDDTLFTLKLTPNLAHCLSVAGIAREVSALTGAPLSLPVSEPVKPAIDARLKVNVEASDLCGRFGGRVLRGVNPQASTPDWMVERLARCGQRSVSALVDISNYVMFELGQPSHVFDLDKIQGELTVRWARVGEQLKLLNGNTITLDEQVGVIADGSQVESLAGVMGGDATAVGDDTRNVYLEAAFWLPKAIAGRARRYNFSTDASHRYERGVDPASTAQHIDRITQLILDICGGEAGPLDDLKVNLPERKPVTLRLSRAQRVIGMAVTLAECQAVFSRLGLSYSTQAHGDDTHLVVTPPSWRFDLQIEEDLIEEVVRVIGFDKLPRRSPKAPVACEVRPEAQRGLYAVRRSVAARGYQEAITFSFVEARWEADFAGNPDPIRLLNPIASQLSVMRSSLIGSLVEVLRTNLARKVDRVRLFEVGRVFRRDAAVSDGMQTVAGFDQPVRLAGLAYGPADALQWGQAARVVDFFDVKGDVESLLAPQHATFVATEHPAFHPGRCAQVVIEGRAVGVVGELHPKWRQAYDLPQAPVIFELDADALVQHPVPRFTNVPRMQSVFRDLALVVNDRTAHDALIAAIMSAPADGLVQGARLFDIYKPKQAVAGIADDERSLAVRIELRDEVQTLNDDRIEAVIQSVLQNLAEKLGARVRA